MESSPSLREAREHIYGIDFSNIIDKLVNHGGWFRKDAEILSVMYRNFLYLNKKYRNQYKIPPSEDIDEFWHMHILDTKAYRRDCQNIFGEYFDHYPYFGIDAETTFADLEGAFASTQSLYLEEFGTQLYEVRNWFKKFLGHVKCALVIVKPKRVDVQRDSNRLCKVNPHLPNVS